MFSFVDICRKYGLRKDSKTFGLYQAFAKILDAELQPKIQPLVNVQEALLLARMPGLARLELNGCSIDDPRLLAGIQQAANDMLSAVRGQIYYVLGIANVPAEGQLYSAAELDRIEAFEQALAENIAPIKKGRKSRNTEKIQYLPLLGQYSSWLVQPIEELGLRTQTEGLNIIAELLLAAGVAGKYSNLSEDDLQINSCDETAHLIKSWLAAYQSKKADFTALEPFQWESLELYLERQQEAKEMRLRAFFQQLDF